MSLSNKLAIGLLSTIGTLAVATGFYIIIYGLSSNEESSVSNDKTDNLEIENTLVSYIIQDILVVIEDYDDSFIDNIYATSVIDNKIGIIKNMSEKSTESSELLNNIVGGLIVLRDIVYEGGETEYPKDYVKLLYALEDYDNFLKDNNIETGSKDGIADDAREYEKNLKNN